MNNNPATVRPGILLALAAALWPAGCAPKVQVKTAVLSDLSGLRTYAWYPSQSSIAGVYGPRQQLASEVIHESIDEGMQRNGFSPVSDVNADILVFYRLGVTIRREVEEYQTVQRNGDTFAVPAEVTIYRSGTLLIYLLNPRTNDVVWVGTAAAETKAARSDSEARSRLERAVRAVFDRMKDDRKS